MERFLDFKSCFLEAQTSSILKSIMMSATLSLQPAGGSLAGIALQIANWHAYSYDGESLSNIGDGGNDMYDNGNRVS